MKTLSWIGVTLGLGAGLAFASSADVDARVEKALSSLAINSQTTDPFGLYQDAKNIPQAPKPEESVEPVVEDEGPAVEPPPVRGDAGTAFARVKVIAYEEATGVITLGNGLRIAPGEAVWSVDDGKRFRFEFVGTRAGKVLFREKESGKEFFKTRAFNR